MPTSEELKQELETLLQAVKDKRLEIKAKLKEEIKELKKNIKNCGSCRGSGRMYLTEGCFCDCDVCGGASGNGLPYNLREGY